MLHDGVVLVLALGILFGICYGQRNSSSRVIVFRDYEDDRYFPEEVSDRGQQIPRTLEIPERLLLRMKNVRNASEFATNFFPTAEDEYRPETVDSGSALGIDGRKKGFAADFGSVAEFAICEPELQTVELQKAEESLVFYWPPCTRIRRCGGCCTSQLLECQPTSTSTIDVKVMKARYSPDNPDDFEFDGYIILTVEKHDKCSCQCKEKATDCTGRQSYAANECRCVCNNITEASSCIANSQMFWDSRNCECVCREIKQCSTGFQFNVQTCRCEAIRNSFIGRSMLLSHYNFSNAFNGTN